jgi:hypothetical protein
VGQHPAVTLHTVRTCRDLVATEWGTRLSMHNSGAAVAQQAPGAPLGLGCRPALPALTGAAGVVWDQ